MKYINTPELLKMIRANMIKDDIKIKDLATLMDKSQSAASSIMRQENISLDSLKEICDALNYDLDIEIKKRQ
jgi:transcriptional regulator with XRE-family HTH domain|nr:MAG TPA: SOS-response transcriptional repressor [Caudoviricetes sp.]